MKGIKKVCAVALAAAVMISGSAIPVAQAEETTPATQISDKEALKQIVEKNNQANMNLTGSDKVMIQKEVLTSPENQMAAFAQLTLLAKNKKVKYTVYDINGDGTPELVALYPNGNLEVYSYDEQLIRNGEKTPKPIGTVKNVKEFRSDKGSKFAVKTVKGKTTSYTTYKFSITKLTKSTTYTKKGKVFKKGKKKIKKKAFNKYVKSFKKLTKKSFEKADVGYVMPLMDQVGFLLMDKDLFVMNKTAEDTGDSLRLVFRKDSDDSGIPFRAFSEVNGEGRRLIFGPDTVDKASGDGKTYLEEDWTYFRDANFSLYNYIPALAELDHYTVTKKSNEANAYDEYIVDYSEDGIEADSYLSVIVGTDENNKDKILEVNDIMSVGLVSCGYNFSYGTDIEIDGEIYSPGLDSMVYANAVTYELPTRQLTIDYNGETKMIMSDKAVRFCPCSKYGTFSMDGVTITPPTTFFSEYNEDIEKYDKLMNPVVDENGFATLPSEDGVGKLSWTPNN